jgi:hypothetical protein
MYRFSPPPLDHHHHHQKHSSLHSSLAGSEKSKVLTDQALIHCSAKNFLTIRHVLSITAVCITLYKAGSRLSSFKLSCNLLGIIPILDSKAIPVQAWAGPEASWWLMLPDFKTSAPEGGKIVSSTHIPPLLPQEILLVIISVRGWVDPRAVVWPERSG